MRTRPFLSALLVSAVSMSVVAAAPAPTAAPGTWVPSMVEQPQGFTTVELFDDGTGYLQRDNSDGRRMWRTDDGGVTFRPVATLPPGRMLDFVGPLTGYSASTGGVWRTDDGATAWSAVPVPAARPGREDTIEAISATGGDGAIALGITHEPATPGDCPFAPFEERVDLAVTRDGGASWDRVPLLDEPGRVQQIEFATPDYGVVIASTTNWVWNGECDYDGSGSLGQLAYVVERTPTEGWTATLVRDCRPRVCRSVGVAEPEVFTLGFADGVVAHTTDGGATFAESSLSATVPDALPPGQTDNVFWVTEIEFATPSVGYAVTNARGMWRTDDGGATWVQEASPREVYDLGIADLAVAGPDAALAGGPALVVRRVTGP